MYPEGGQMLSFFGVTYQKSGPHAKTLLWEMGLFVLSCSFQHRPSQDSKLGICIICQREAGLILLPVCFLFV